MLASISNHSIPRISLSELENSQWLFLKLPVEIKLILDDYLTIDDLLRLMDAMTMPTRDGSLLNSPVLKFFLMRYMLKPEHQRELFKTSTYLLINVLQELQKLEEAWKFDQVAQKHILSLLYLMRDHPSIIESLKQQVQQKPIFKQTLLKWIEHSKTETVGRVAAYALTSLVRGGMQFNGADLRGIRVAGADLSGGVFDSAQLQGADLSNVQLQDIWLRQANLNDTQMEGVELGKSLFLKKKHSIRISVHSPDGKTWAVNTVNGIVLYKTPEPNKIHVLSGPKENAANVVYSPNSQQIAADTLGNTVQVWDVQTGRLIHILSGHTKPLNKVAYSPDGRQIAALSYGKTMLVWDAQSGQLCRTSGEPTDWVSRLVYFPGDRQRVYHSYDTVRDAQDSQTDHALNRHMDAVTCVVCSPNGQQIASGSRDQTVRLWDTQTGKLIYTLRGHTEQINKVVYSPDSRWIASSSGYETMRVWDTQTGILIHTLDKNTYWPNHVTYSLNGERIAFSGVYHRRSYRWNTDTGKPISTLSGDAQVVYSPNGEQIACIQHCPDSVQVLNAQTGTLIYTLSSHTSNIYQVVYSPDGQQIASCSRDNTVRLWNAETGELIHTLYGYIDVLSNACFSWVYSVVYSPNGQQIASTSHSGHGSAVQLWNAQTGTHLFTLYRNTRAVYSPNSQQIASVTEDGTVYICDVTSGQCQAIIEGFHTAIFSISWQATPYGDYLITGCADHSVLVWQVEEVDYQYKVRLCWSSTHKGLTASQTSIKKVQGLSAFNKKLLRQCGAVGAPLA